MSAFVGIDLGTTYSAVAYVNAQGRPEIIPNVLGKGITPSVIAFDTGMPIVGEEAKERQFAGETEVAAFFKRHMGDPHYLYTFAGRDYTPTDLSAVVLQFLKKQAEHYLSTSVNDAVITVPAYFTHTQRSATIEAGRLAGLRVLKVISEPTAAALAYGLRPSAANGKQPFLVYDLGGGTFDVSLISLSADELTVLATDGDHNLGGKDWDDRLLAYLDDQFQQECGCELLGDDINELRVQVEKLKHSLSARQRADIRVQAAGHVGVYTITRELFENLTRDLMERTQLLTERVLEEKGLTWRELEGVLLVGGSTRMPMVQTFTQRMSGKPAMGGINPDEAVALGAAIQATMEMEEQSSTQYALAGRKHTIDVIAHSLGMIAISEDRSHYLNSILIRKNLSIPSAQTRPYKMTLRKRDATQLEVFLTQGESTDPQQCAYLGRYVFDQFPALSVNEAILDITYAYDKNGLVNISAIERSTHQPLRLSVEPVPADVPARFLQSPDALQPEREHITVYLAFDLSGSMSGRPLAAAQKAAEEFVSQCDLTTTSVGLISFSNSILVDLPASQNAQEISRAIRNLSIGRTGYGNSAHPFNEIYTRMINLSGIRYVVVLADGVWFCQRAAIKEAKRCHQVPIEVIAVGFGRADKAFLQAIASSSEQSLFTDLSRLSETFSTIAQEITEASGKRPGNTHLYLTLE